MDFLSNYWADLNQILNFTSGSKLKLINLNKRQHQEHENGFSQQPLGGS
jgi:hypothetical protein